MCSGLDDHQTLKNDLLSEADKGMERRQMEISARGIARKWSRLCFAGRPRVQRVRLIPLDSQKANNLSARARV